MLKTKKVFTIALRTVDGWLMKQENKSKTHCDCCNAKLWVAPHGMKYCDEVHDENK